MRRGPRSCSADAPCPASGLALGPRPIVRRRPQAPTRAAPGEPAASENIARHSQDLTPGRCHGHYGGDLDFDFRTVLNERAHLHHAHRSLVLADEFAEHGADLFAAGEVLTLVRQVPSHASN